MNDHGNNLLVRYQNVVRGAIGRQQQRTKNDKWRDLNSRSALRGALLKIRERLPRGDRPEFFEWFDRLAGGLGPDFYSTMVQDLTVSVSESRSLTVSSELEWIGFRLRAHLDDLRTFRELANRLDEGFWQDNPEAVKETVQKTYEECGPSLWLLAAEIAFEQEFNGLEAQKHIITKVRKRYPGGLPVYFAFYFSIRNEERSVYRQFHHEFRERIAASNHKSSIKAYIEYKVLGETSGTDESYSSILRIEQGQSLYDLYETTIDLLQRSLALPLRPTWGDAALALLRDLETVGDWRVPKLLAAFGAVNPLGEKRSVFEDATTPAVAPIGQRPVLSFWRLVEGKISIDDYLKANRSPRELTLTTLLNDMLERGPDFEDSIGRLTKFARNFFFLPPAKAIGTVVDFVTNPTDSMRTTIGASALNDPGISVIDLLTQDDASAEIGSAAWQDIVGRSESMRWSATLKPELSPALAPLDWYLYCLRLGGSDVLAAGEILGEVPRTSLSSAQQVLFTNLELQLQLATGDWRECVSTIAREIAKNPNVISVMPVKEALADRTWENLSSVSDKVDLSLALYAYWKQTDDSVHATYLRFSFEEVLFSAGYEYPSLFTSSVIETDQRLAFFLEHVCVPSLMDTSGFFSSSAELLDERVKVLEVLAAARPEEAERFLNEIDGINVAKLIKSGLELVDSNRVAVDTSALTRWASRKYRVSYSRYLALCGANLGTGAKFEDIMKQVEAAIDMAGDYFTIPDNEADTLLLDIVLALKEQFLNDPQYGLEYFLGKRIRHGTIAGHMRGPAEAAHLITERRTPASPYEPNIFWLNRIECAGDAQRTSASLAFDRFSEKYDVLISDVRDKYLHVKTATHPDGIFDITITAPQFHVLKAVITSDIDFEQFVNVCFQTFWVLLSPSLTQARDFLRSEVRRGVVQLYGELQSQLEASVDTPECSRNASIAIQAVSTEVQRELDIVGSWFERIEGREAHRFSLEHAIEISVQSALKSLTTFRPVIEWRIEEGVDTTQSILLVLWEFVFVVIDNVYRRARVGNTPKIQIDCSLDAINKRLRVSIINPIGAQVDFNEVQNKLRATRDKIAAGDILKGAAADRGSGLLKVAALVREYSSGSLVFTMNSNSLEFFTTLEIPVFIAKGAITLPVPELTIR